jgi:hypothetical protein
MRRSELRAIHGRATQMERLAKARAALLELNGFGMNVPEVSYEDAQRLASQIDAAYRRLYLEQDAAIQKGE